MTRLGPIRSLALAALLSAFGQGAAHAGFSYVSDVSPTATLSGASVITLLDAAGGVPFSLTTPTDITLFNITNASLAPASATDAFAVNFTDLLSITNVPPPGSPATGAVTITGSLIFTRNDISGSVSTLQVGQDSYTVLVDSVRYTISNFSYARATVNGLGLGSVSATVTAQAVPEPASVALVGLGLAGVGTIARRRRAATA
jgi:hypothetical protein